MQLARRLSVGSGYQPDLPLRQPHQTIGLPRRLLVRRRDASSIRSAGTELVW